jgi:peptidoglycan/LPS O-acetylase OafA/YrhL
VRPHAVLERHVAIGRLNNFDALRLAAAVLVVVGHAFILAGAGAPPAIFGTPVDTLGVYVFFSISGFLVSGSWDASPRLVRFFRHRCLRIFPALVVVILTTVFVIGPLASTDGVLAYFQSNETWAYLQGTALLAQYDLPGVFAGSAHARSAVNGSLWTLGVEFSCYIAVAAVGLALRERARPIAFGILGLLAILIVATSAVWDVPKGIFDACRVVPFFAAGAIIRTSLPPRLLNWRTAIALLVVWEATAILWPSCALAAGWTVVPYASIAIGVVATPVVRRAARFGDLSYGTYLWAFLIQQVELDVAGRVPLVFDIPIVVAMTVGIAWISWNCIERPALSFKDPVVFGDQPALQS